MSETIFWTLVETPSDALDDSPGFLAAPEIRKLSGLRFPKRRQEWLLGRWTAKSLVKSTPAYQQYSLDQIEIHNDPGGAPRLYLDGSISLDCLTISHRDHSAFCAFNPDGDLSIGADLETVEPRSPAFVADYFTPWERTLVEACRSESRESAACLIWSAKESMLKALGVGLRWDTRQVEIVEIAGLEADPGAGDWHPLQVRDAIQGDRPWAAWWQRRRNYILTLAAYPGVPVDGPTIRLVEKCLEKGPEQAK
jgi:4'-phosphopantetheinyl transferase